MPQFSKATRTLSTLVIMILVLLELCHTSPADRHSDTLQTLRHRRKRQTGDIYLMKLKAQGALKGTTKPTEYFRRIGKKRTGSFKRTRLSDMDQLYLAEALAAGRRGTRDDYFA